ncbi:YceD family protein, partial [Ideonella sp.]|uniref:YceD family protein n=1 Tax=Ideonella sp. TaxID=1929293 RepID=UPI003BB7AA67
QLCCQRCLGPVGTEMALDRWVRFVSDEESAAALDAESEDDVLALERWMDLRELIEDELLLALPLVPRHQVCPAPLPLPSDADVEESPAPNPFAVLAKLKRGEA